MSITRVRFVFVTLFLGLFWVNCSDNSNPTVPPDTPPTTYTLTTAANPVNGGSVSRDPDLESYSEGAVVALIAEPNNGYTFTGWTGAPSGVNASNAFIAFAMNSNLTLTANFDTIPEGRHAVTVVSAGTGAIGTGSYKPGDTVTIGTGTPPAGQMFANWTTTSSGVTFANADSATTSFIMPTNTVTVTAVFEVIPEVIDLSSALRAQPVAAFDFGEPITPLDYWTDGEKNYYIIYAGHIRNTLVMQLGPVEYPGVGTIAITRTETEETTIARSKTETVLNSIVVSEGGSITEGGSQTNTTSIENVRRRQEEAGGSAGIGWGPFGASANFKNTIENITTTSNSSTTFFSYETSSTFNTTVGRSTETSDSFMESLRNSVSTATTMTIGLRDDPAGHYRYAWYAITDVYFVVATSLDNQTLLGWEVVSCVRGQFEQRLEYAQLGIPHNERFDNAPSNNIIVLPENFWKDLPMPGHVLAVNAEPATGGTVIRNPNRSNYESGTTVTVTAIPSEGYKFVSWTGAPTVVNDLNPAITFVINNNMALTANFEQGFTDARDEQRYRTVVIGGRTWMAENLNYEMNDSWCYDDIPANCNIYGRLYTWDAAMAACPAGWSLPAREEWNELIDTAGGGEDASRTLRALPPAWDGDDNFGFSALPGGHRRTDDSFWYIGEQSGWWTATEFSATSANQRSTSADRAWNGRSISKHYGLSVRCIKN